jgi:hypothetical protein
MSTAVHITRQGAQINCGDLPPYLTYGAYGFMLSGIVTTVLPPLAYTQIHVYHENNSAVWLCLGDQY